MGANGERNGKERRVLGLYLLAMVAVLGAPRRKRLGGLGGVLGTALWSQSSGARESASELLSQSQTDRVQLSCEEIVPRPGQGRARACRAVVAWRCRFDAV
jgi:hypothetical protein